MYRNKKTGKISDKKYRFKTEEEFEKEFGLDWYNNIYCGWNRGGMDYLFGQDLELPNSDGDYLYLSEDPYNTIPINKGNYGNGSWTVTKDMILPNQAYSFKNIYLKDKENIYENIITKFNKFNR